MTDVPIKLNDLQLPAATVLVKGLSRPLQGEKVRIWQVPAGAVSSALMRDLDLLIIPKKAQPNHSKEPFDRTYIYI